MDAMALCRAIKLLRLRASGARRPRRSAAGPGRWRGWSNRAGAQAWTWGSAFVKTLIKMPMPTAAPQSPVPAAEPGQDVQRPVLTFSQLLPEKVLRLAGLTGGDGQERGGHDIVVRGTVHGQTRQVHQLQQQPVGRRLCFRRGRRPGRPPRSCRKTAAASSNQISASFYTSNTSSIFPAPRRSRKLAASKMQEWTRSGLGTSRAVFVKPRAASRGGVTPQANDSISVQAKSTVLGGFLPCSGGLREYDAATKSGAAPRVAFQVPGDGALQPSDGALLDDLDDLIDG